MTRSHVIARTAASLLGGYLFVWGFTSLGITLGVAAGMPYEEARTLVSLFSFLIFLACFCWAFAAVGVARVWAVLGGGGGAMTGVAWLLSRALS